MTEEYAPAVVTEQQRKLCELLVDGKSKLHAAKELGISRETVYAWLERTDVAKYLRELVGEKVDALDVQIVGSIDMTQELLRGRLEWDMERLKARSEDAPTAEGLIRITRQLYELAAMRRGLTVNPSGQDSESKPAGLDELRERTGSLDERISGAKDVTPKQKQEQE